MSSVDSNDIILAVNIICFVIGLPANLLALYAFSAKIQSKPLPVDILLLNLTVSDLLFLIILPLKMHEAASDMSWTLPLFMCTVTAFIFFSTVYTSSLLLMAVSVVRYIGVVFPFKYKKLTKPVYVNVTCAFIWLISAAHCSITIIIEHSSNLSSGNSSMSYQNFTSKQLEVPLPVRLEMFFLLFLIPFLVCIYCYVHCIMVLYSRTKVPRSKKQRVIGMALGTLAMYLICVLPYNISHVLGYFQSVSPDWRHYTVLLFTTNTCIDPIIYYFSSSAFRCRSKESMLRRHLLKMLAQTSKSNS